MYERFTDRSRRVMQLANKEAQRFNHEYIGTEHILLGLIREGSGVAPNVLKNLNIDHRKVRLEVEKLMQSGPDMVTMGKLPQTPRAKKVIEYAMEEAQKLQHDFIGTEHLLLGLLCETEGVASQVLMNLGLKLETVREEVLHLLGCAGPKPDHMSATIPVYPRELFAVNCPIHGATFLASMADAGTGPSFACGCTWLYSGGNLRGWFRQVDVGMPNAQ